MGLSLMNRLRLCQVHLPYIEQVIEKSDSEAYIISDGQSASLSWNKTPNWSSRPDFYYCETVACLLMWDDLSDERTGL
jgi:hypothetical protein